MLNRRQLIVAAFVLAGAPATAHHGWSSFDQDKPQYLAGTVKTVHWQNPHAELVITAPAGLAVPADLASRKLPAQSQAIDGAAVARKATVPAQAAGEWELELSPLSRLSAWGATEPKVGDRVEAIGYLLASGGERVMRVEYLFANGKVYGLRSSPQ